MTIVVALAIAVASITPARTVPRPADGDDITRGRAALERLAERHSKLRTMTGTFVQEIHTPLSKRPLTSHGTLAFRRTPACAVFELTKPRHSIVRFDERSYRVHRPDEKRAETFIFKANDLAGAFVKIFAPNAKEMEKIFRLASSRSIPAEPVTKTTGEEVAKSSLEIVLLPLDKKLENHFVELRLVIEPETGSLRRIAYTNAQGDVVAIILSHLKIDPRIDPKTFDAPLPDGTRTKVHRL